MRLFVSAISLLLALCLLPATSSDAADPSGKPRNVVLIVADDLGHEIGCYGHPDVKTPGLDRLAAMGTRFTRAACTTASCSASRSVLMTGLQNHATGHYGHAHSYSHFSTYETVRSLPLILSEAGYRTCSIGKYHLAPEYVYPFDAFRNEGTQGSRNGIRMAENAREWITEDDDRPFFLYYCSLDPHRGAGPDKFANFNDNPGHYENHTRITYDPQMLTIPHWLPDTPEAREELAQFYQAISRFDQGVNHLLDVLTETGHLDDTLIIMLADNGAPFPGAKTTLYEPGMNLPLIVRHPDQKKRGITCDAMITWVDIAPTILDFCNVDPGEHPPVVPRENVGRRITEPVGGRRNRNPRVQPYTFHGRSFLPVVEQENPEGWDEMFASHTFHELQMYYPMRMYRNGKYKLLFNIAHQLPYPFASDLYASPTWQGVLERQDEMYGQRSVYAYVNRPKFELYDLEADPYEVKNLAFEPEHAARLEEMQERLKKWQEETRDPWLSKWTYE